MILIVGLWGEVREFSKEKHHLSKHAKKWGGGVCLFVAAVFLWGDENKTRHSVWHCKKPVRVFKFAEVDTQQRRSIFSSDLLSTHLV